MQLIEIENEVLSGQDAFPLSFKTQEKVSGNPSYQLVFQVAEADLDLVSLLGKSSKSGLSYLTQPATGPFLPM